MMVIASICSVILIIGLLYKVVTSESLGRLFLHAILMICASIIITVGLAFHDNLGSAIKPGNLPQRLKFGKVYTTVAVTEKFAVISDGGKTPWSTLPDNNERAWLIRISQTNMIAGEQYMLVEEKEGKEAPYFVKVGQ